MNKDTQQLENLQETLEKDSLEREKLAKLRIQRQSQLKSLFVPTHSIVNIAIDCKHELLKFTNYVDRVDQQLSEVFDDKHHQPIYQFKELLGYELLQDDHVIMCGGYNKPLLEKFDLVEEAPLSLENCHQLNLLISFNDMDYPEIVIVYVDEQTKINATNKQQYQSYIQDTISALNIILRNNEKTKILEALRM